MKSPLLTSDESVILLELASGNEMAYNYFVEKYWQKVLQQALSFVKSYPVAEELTQDIFIQIWQKKEKLSEIKSFDNYLFIVSRNLIISHIRKKLIETESFKGEKLQEMFLKPDEQYEYKELDKIINEGANLLTEPRRTIFLLSRVEGKDTDFISSELGLAKRTIRWHLLEALNFLRIYLHRHYGIRLLILLGIGLRSFISSFL
ncbi:sigma-70 family RNA polymerase sigma factor [Flavobacterium sp. M31R6]|uniref:sigma-70 family RNA polymerase sigma factor n=1 Tax=Flavobacterium sp. M31R6 TaxID=2739062 RepID=UPI001569772B|nr:sigma-70 family RNA polymerase sigma factor [Flavobacterium sp. M31R6]QKJ63375.1 sigma-70 family RNA polymerase sigma factor [Flavobacterium sp. M31R6]